LLIGGGLGGKH